MGYCLILLPKVTVKFENQISLIPSSYLSALCLCLPSSRSLTWQERGLHPRSREHSRALVRCMGSNSKLRAISFKWVISRLVKRYHYTWVRPRHAISGTNHTEGCAANQTCGKASLYPQSELALQSWLSGAGQSDGSAQNQEWNSPIDWAFEWLLIVLGAEGKPSPLTPGLLMVRAGPCDPFGHWGAPKAWPAAQWCVSNRHRASFNADSVSWSHCSKG